MRYERLECARVRHKCDRSETQATRVLHECYRKDTGAAKVKYFDFDSDTSENIFSHSYIYYMATERLQGEKQFHFKNYLLGIPCSHAKMRLKSAPQKLDFVMACVSSYLHLECISWKRDHPVSSKAANVTKLYKVIVENSYRFLQVTRN